jgi:hypothetical protein
MSGRSAVQRSRSAASPSRRPLRGLRGAARGRLREEAEGAVREVAGTRGPAHARDGLAHDRPQSEHEDFIGRYEKLFKDAFGAGALPKLKGENALRFLGLGKPGAKNRWRLEAFYAKHGIAKPGWGVA